MTRKQFTAYLIVKIKKNNNKNNSDISLKRKKA